MKALNSHQFIHCDLNRRWMHVKIHAAGLQYLWQQTMLIKGISVGQLILFYGYALFYRDELKKEEYKSGFNA